MREHLSKSNDVECLHFTVHRSLYAHLPKKHHNLRSLLLFNDRGVPFHPDLPIMCLALTHEYALNLKETNPIL